MHSKHKRHHKKIFLFVSPPLVSVEEEEKKKTHRQRERERDDVVKDEESARWRERIRAHRPTGVPVGV